MITLRRLRLINWHINYCSATATFLAFFRYFFLSDFTSHKKCTQNVLSTAANDSCCIPLVS